MSENERELLDNLRALAALEPREAPARVEEALRARFRARVQYRRLKLWGSAAAGFAAVAAAIVTLFWMSPAAAPQFHPIQAPAAQSGVRGLAQTEALPPAPDSESVPQVQYAVVRADEVTSSFYPLPEADALPALETAMVVRVELPMSSLRLMGFPIGGDFNADPIQADVLLGQDGLARGVRVIQQ